MKPKYDGQIRPNLKERKYGQPDTEGNIRYWREYWDGVKCGKEKGDDDGS